MRHVVLFLMLAGFVLGAEIIENHQDDVRTHFVMRDSTTGLRDTGVVIANLEMYYVEDDGLQSADVFVGAHAAGDDAHTDGECFHMGHGLYRVDWPDAAFDGGVGKRVHLHLIDGDAGANTETLVYLLSPSVNVTQLDGSDVQQTGGHIHALDDAGAALCPSGEPLTAQEVEDTVWDAVLTGASHNDATSAGRRLRQTADATVIREEEQAQGGTASTITLNSNASALDGFYNNTQIIIVGDTGVGQMRHIHSYVGATRIATVGVNWVANPDATSDYVIRGDTTKHVDDISNDVITAGVIANAALDAATFAADVDGEIAAYIWNAATGSYGGVGTYGQAAEDTLADTNELQADWTNGGRLDLIIDLIQAYWDSLTITGGLLEVVHGNI